MKASYAHGVHVAFQCSLAVKMERVPPYAAVRQGARDQEMGGSYLSVFSSSMGKETTHKKVT